MCNTFRLKTDNSIYLKRVDGGCDSAYFSLDLQLPFTKLLSCLYLLQPLSDKHIGDFEALAILTLKQSALI